MVCNRCIRVVKEELEKMDLTVTNVQLGEVEVQEDLNNSEIEKLRKVLQESGFDLLDDKKKQLVEKIKKTIIQVIHQEEAVDLHLNFSFIIQQAVGKDYQYLSNLFSSIEGLTIEKFIILQKVERVKELIMYDELSLSQISYKLGYSSPQHLSSQFKKVIGLTPSDFKNLHAPNRKPLDNLG